MSLSAYQSPDLTRMPIIDSDDHPLCDPNGFGRGRLDRPADVGFSSGIKQFDLPLIPRSEWAERIRDLEKSQARIPDLCDALGLKVKNQESTNYCWINAPTHALEILRVMQGEPYVELSPASVGAKIKNFHNVGGWGTEGLQYLVDHGAVPASMWPCNAIDRRYDQPAADAERSKYRVQEWLDLPANNFDAVMTCLLLGLPVPIGLGWWSHEVTAVAPVKFDGNDNYGVIFDNSWDSQWGTNGRGVLTERKATPDDAVAPISVVAG